MIGRMHGRTLHRLGLCPWLVVVLASLGCQLGLGSNLPGDDDTTGPWGDDDASSGDDDTGSTSDDDTGSTGDDDTGSAGDDDTADALLDQVYFLDLGDSSFEFTEPAGMGALLQSQIPRDDGAVFAATTIGGGSVEMLFGAAIVLNPLGDPPDWIWEQTDHPTTTASGSWSGTSFSVGPFATSIEISGTDVWFGDAQFSGTYAADGSEVTGADVDMLVDTTHLSDVVGIDLCTLIACTTCPAGCPNSGDNCIRVVAEGGTCPLLEDLYLVEWP